MPISRKRLWSRLVEAMTEILIETQRLLLRGFVASDEFLLVPLLMDADFMSHAPAGAFDKVTAKSRFEKIRADLANTGIGKLAVVLKSSRTLIGYCGIEPCVLDGRQEIELGYRLLKSARGLGYATEAAQALLDYYKKIGVDNIVAFTEPQNAASINVLKKLGYLAVAESVYQGMPIRIFRHP